MNPHTTPTQAVAACQSPQGVLESVRDRLGELGTLDHKNTLDCWEEALGLGHLSDNLTGSLNHMEGEPGDLIPVCLDIAASAIRLANAMAKTQRELDLNSPVSKEEVPA